MSSASSNMTADAKSPTGANLSPTDTNNSPTGANLSPTDAPSSTTEAPFGPYAAAAVIVANMVGTGVFTSLGFQLQDIRSTFVLLLLWAVGGAAAFCGAVSYAELGAAIPRSGGEYTFLSRIYHPGAGFISGWISATIGFAAPTALAAITFGTYLASVFPELSPMPLAVSLVVVLTGVHITSRRNSSLFQQAFTTVKVLLIVAFCAAAFFVVGDPQPVVLVPRAGDGGLIFSGSFAVSLIYVSYAYTGWNAATYLTSELRNPTKTLPVVLGAGTLLVTVLYLALHFAFLRAAPMDAMVGKLEIGYIAATYMFGNGGASIMGVALSLLLVSTVSAMVMAGPRVLQVIGEDYPVFKILGKRNQRGIPAVAIMTQSVLTLGFILTASFESILVFSGFTLGLNTLLTVAGLFYFRWREPDAPRPYRAWGYPYTPIIYLTLTMWTLGYLLLERPLEAWLGIGVIVVGGVFYLMCSPRKSPR